MERKTFSEKVNHLMTLYWMGVDISEVQNSEDYHDLNENFSYEDTLDHQMMREIKDRIEPLLYDFIEPARGKMVAEKIILEVEDRMDFMEKRFQYAYEERENETRKESKEQENGDYLQEEETAKANELQMKKCEECIKRISEEQEKRVSALKGIEQDMVWYFNGVQNALNGLENDDLLHMPNLAGLASDIIFTYAQKGNHIAKNMQTEFANLERGVLRHQEEQPEIAGKLHIDTKELYQKIQRDSIMETQKMGPEELGIEVCMAKENPLKDFMGAEDIVEKGVLISKSILDRAKEDQNENIFREEEHYHIEEREYYWIVLTEAEAEKVEDIAKRKKQEIEQTPSQEGIGKDQHGSKTLDDLMKEFD